MLFEMPQIAIAVGGMISVAAILGGIWFQIARVKSNNELKRSLVERGMSVEEIERVMAAGASGKSW